MEYVTCHHCRIQIPIAALQGSKCPKCHRDVRHAEPSNSPSDQQAKSSLWYVYQNDQQFGPYSGKELKRYAVEGYITPQTWVRKGESGKWVMASKIKGLDFHVRESADTPDSEAQPSIPNSDRINQPSTESNGTAVRGSSSKTKTCPFCGETILLVAKKCKHCGEFLDMKHTSHHKSVETNVKQGAFLGAAVCFFLGLFLMSLSIWSFILYSPLFFAAFLLSIVAMAQGRVTGGVSILLLTVVIPPILFLLLL